MKRAGLRAGPFNAPGRSLKTRGRMDTVLDMPAVVVLLRVSRSDPKGNYHDPTSTHTSGRRTAVVNPFTMWEDLIWLEGAELGICAWRQ